jgi:CheY-like chemotaxis protein
MQAQLLQAQKMEAVGRLAGGVAHDFNNVLTTINGYSEILMRCLEQGDPMVKSLEQIYRAAQHAASLTHQLLAFSRRQVVQPKVLDLGAVVADMDKMLQRVIGEDVELVMVRTPGLAYIKADLGQMEQVIMNLAVNARDAMPHGGKLTIKTGNVTLNKRESKLFPEARPGTFVLLSVEDTGTGIDKEIIDRIFEPFFTTKGPAQGTGLGLSTVYGIVRQHGGWIDVCSEPRQGSTFKVYLPAIAAKREDETEESISLHELQGGGERILLVEDETEVRQVIAKLLGENGYIVFEAGSSEEALDIFEREMGNFRLVFSDVVLPGKDGLQLVEQLVLYKPELRVLLTSGYSDDRSRWLDVQQRGFRFVEKPLTSADLLRATRQAIELAR